MRFTRERNGTFELIVRDPDGDVVFRDDYGLDLSMALAKADEFEDLHPDWSIEIWRFQIVYKQGQPS